jgi:hypothetical protein
MSSLTRKLLASQKWLCSAELQTWESFRESEVKKFRCITSWLSNHSREYGKQWTLCHLVLTILYSEGNFIKDNIYLSFVAVCLVFLHAGAIYATRHAAHSVCAWQCAMGLAFERKSLKEWRWKKNRVEKRETTGEKKTVREISLRKETFG